MSKLIVIASLAMAIFALVALGELIVAQESNDGPLSSDQDLPSGPPDYTLSRHKVGFTSKMLHTNDVLDKNVGIPEIVKKQKSPCQGQRSAEKCRTCCLEQNMAPNFQPYAKFLGPGKCSCLDRNNSYT